MVVIDACAILAWCFEDERPKNAETVLAGLVAHGLVAPQHWPLEVANTLWAAERRKRITAAHAAEFLSLLEAIEVEIDSETARRAWQETRAVSQRFDLTIYDAAYLELALRRGAAIASRDSALMAAARVAGVEVLAI